MAADAEKSAETHDRELGLPGCLVEHDVMHGAELFAGGVIDGGAADLTGGDQPPGGCVEFAQSSLLRWPADPMEPARQVQATRWITPWVAPANGRAAGMIIGRHRHDYCVADGVSHRL